MTIRDEILEEFRNGTSLAEIRRKYRSQSQLYEALRIFWEEADKRVEETREKLEKAEHDLLRTEAELEEVSLKKEEVSSEIQELVQAKEKLTEEVRRESEELDSLNAQITELSEKGFSPEIVQGIEAIESRSGSELLSQVGTAEKYRQIKKELPRLKRKKAVLERQFRALKEEKKRIEVSLVSEKNELDNLKLQTAAFIDVVAAVKSLFEAGYSSDDIMSLKCGVQMLGIKGKPLLSIKRLVEGLEKQKSLMVLQDEIVQKEKELETLQKTVADAEAGLKVAKELTEAFEDVKNAGIEAITNVAEQTNKKLESTATGFEKHAMESLGWMDTKIQEATEQLRLKYGDLSELQQKKAKLEEVVGPGLVLLGILRSTEYLKQVPLPLIVQLLERLQLWSEINLQDVSIRPSQKIWGKEMNLNPLQIYKVTALIEFLREGLEEILLEQVRKDR